MGEGGQVGSWCRVTQWPINRVKDMNSGGSVRGAPKGDIVGFWFNQIPLRLKLRKDRKIKILLLLKLGIKVCQMITERYTHFNPL
jgi:hypothetical protein